MMHRAAWLYLSRRRARSSARAAITDSSGMYYYVQVECGVQDRVQELQVRCQSIFT